LEEIDGTNWKYAHIFFQCVAVASRPLRVDELAQFLSFDFEAESTPTFLADWRPEDSARTVLSMCSSLLAVVQPNGYDSPIVQFAHFSAQEYLTSARLAGANDTISRFHLSMTPAHTVVAQACLGLLLHLDETVTKDSLENFPLAEYAAQYWVGHARIEDVSPTVQDGINRLFDPGKSHFSLWVWIYDLEDDGPFWDRPTRSERPGKARATPLHYAAFCGLHDVAKSLIVEHSQEVYARGFSWKETPLHVASRCGHADIAQLLLEHGADGSADDRNYRTPLHMSSEYGHVEVAQILLECGAHTESRDRFDMNPLELASRGRYVEVAQLLFKYGADANNRGKSGYTALHRISVFGYVGVARVLLEHGADANARNIYHETPLHEASSNLTQREERFDLVRLLVQHGSDIHARDDKGRTPFMVATKNECHEIMQLLLEYGAEDHRKG
jgi:ankyrin repeat protein